jgi:hypothetical protein
MKGLDVQIRPSHNPVTQVSNLSILDRNPPDVRTIFASVSRVNYLRPGNST